MSIYKIMQNGEEINRIVASGEFVEKYYSECGYSYELCPEPVPAPDPEPESEPTETERIRADVDYLAALAGVEL